MGFFEKIKQGLAKTKQGIMGQVDSMLRSFVKIDEDFFEELEELLIMADVGIETSEEIIERLRDKVKDERETNSEAVKEFLKEIVSDMLRDEEGMHLSTKPSVILVVGVNGVGKTTSIGKIANLYKQQGKKVILGAADTFRAAAAEQLCIWADRAGCDIVHQKEGTDPAAVVFDTISAGKSRGVDIIICDTAGRLHNKKNLMDELGKMIRVIDRELPDADKEILLVCDATTGQNGLNQAKEFKNVAPLTGIILTKLDGTAKGGIVVAIKHELDIPIRFVGVGEQMDDLQEFVPEEFANALFEGQDSDNE
ncbi:MAG: signal recognition particle-docking protein FtsY [Bacillota bacterium]|nr:signal recognition particle-docking protein FtsY [Bacillota bacterium]